MINDVKHLFMCSLIIWKPSLVKILYSNVNHFKNRFVCLFLIDLCEFIEYFQYILKVENNTIKFLEENIE